MSACPHRNLKNVVETTEIGRAVPLLPGGVDGAAVNDELKVPVRAATDADLSGGRHVDFGFEFRQILLFAVTGNPTAVFGKFHGDRTSVQLPFPPGWR